MSNSTALHNIRQVKNLNSKKWGFIFCLHLMLFWTCSKIETNTIGQHSSHIDSLLTDAVNDSHRENFDVVIRKLKEVIRLAESIEDGRNQVLGTINLGNLYLYYNADEEALNYFIKSLDLAEKFKVEGLLNTIYNNIGIVYSSNDEFEKAEEYFLKSLAISQQRNEPKRIAINLINLGNVKEQEKSVEQAITYYQQALELFQEQKDSLNIAAVMNNIGNVFFQKENYSDAKNYYHEALELIKSNPENRYQPFFQLNYGKALLQFQEHDSALFYLHNSLDTFLLLKNTDKIIESYDFLAKVYEDIGQNEKAIGYFVECLSWKDTLLYEKKKKWISEIQMKYEFGKKEKEIEFLQRKSKQEKLIWGGMILGLLIFSVLLFYSVKVKNTNLKQKNIILEKEQELTNLKMAKHQLLQEQLKQKLEMKNRELTSKAMQLLNKNEILNSVTSLLDKLTLQHETQNANLVRNAKNAISRNINLDEQWEDFKIHFEEVHTGFFSRILQDYPSLSQTDLRLSAYLLINLNSKEIAQISNISPNSVRKRKQRLREKLSLSKEQDIRTLLNRYS